MAGLPEQESQVLVVDVGGSSTETSWQQENQIKRVSVNVGAVRATEGHYHPAQINALLSPALKAVPRDIKTAIAVGGTATTVAAMLQQMTVYQPEKIHLFPVTSTELQELGQQVNRLTLAERRQLPGLQPARADIIPAGITIISAALEILKISSFIVSEADILWGMALMAAVNVDKKSGLGLP